MPGYILYQTWLFHGDVFRELLLFPVVGNCLFLSHKFPGPGEDGLMWMHEESKEGVEGFGKFFFGPFPSISVIHPDTVKIILKTSGTIVVCIS